MMAHTSLCLFMTNMITWINPHIITSRSHILIPVAQDNLFPVHITTLQYTCAVFDSSVLTDGCLRTLSLYSRSHVRSCTPCLRTGACPTCPTSLHGGTVCTSVRRSNNLASKYSSAPDYSEQQVYTSNITFKDKYNPVRVKHQYIYIYIYTSIATLPPSAQMYSKQGATRGKPLTNFKKGVNPNNTLPTEIDQSSISVPLV